ncbi:MAG: ABC transporter permease subunit [Parcubacteria group bacterium]|nr:ABC transporter permease subunit [Parcubacteria group bacterium]
MNSIFTITLKELRSYFTSPIAYVVFTMFLVLSGYFFSVILFISKEASFRGAASNIIITLLFLMPLITMRMFSEERKMGTLELLMTKPVRDIEVMLGKFLAAAILFITMLASTLVYIFILTKYGNPDMGPIWSAYLGILLCGLSFIALGIFASTLTENQIIAAVIGFALVLLLWVMSWISGNLGEVDSELLSYISLSTHLEGFVKGVINLKDVVYYLSFIVFWLFVSVKSIEIRKWK